MTATRKEKEHRINDTGMGHQVDQLLTGTAQVDVSDLVQLDGKVAVNTTDTQTISGAKTFSNAVTKMTALPTADPHVVGQLWANSGVVTVSAG